VDTALATEIARQALLVTIYVSGPILLTMLVVGLVIGILQAATSINEMTISFVPKIIAAALAIAVVGAWQLTTLVDFMKSIFTRIPSLFI
jgi:flagellar biosynthetic protein FliQ